ncbi:hypothetical protein JYU14_03450 [Simkania negevensis]|uniref:Uncharacterized protein n=1 Tax=Simkania negevensis TaxID=83561 RepID=A0ABS3AQV6_9BACT|nr:hypothetical protein [Simkania negevensis]
MNAILFAMGILSACALLTYSQLQHASTQQVRHHFYAGYHSAQKEALHKHLQATFEELKKQSKAEDHEEGKKNDPHKEQPGGRSTSRWKIRDIPTPDNAKLNFAPLFQHEEGNHYETIARLFRILYGKEKFFTRTPRAEYQIIDALTQHRYSSPYEEISSPDHLLSIILDDPSLQILYTQMLKGSAFFSLQKGSGYPSLLEYATLHRESNKINFHYAPKAILLTLIDNERIVSELAHTQKTITAEVCKDKDEADDILYCLHQSEIADIFAHYGDSIDNYRNIFEFSNRTTKSHYHYVTASNKEQTVTIRKRF